MTGANNGLILCNINVFTRARNKASKHELTPFWSQRKKAASNYTIVNIENMFLSYFIVHYDFGQSIPSSCHG